MKRRNLQDILREVQNKGVKDAETIKQYMYNLSNRTLYSLMYGDKERCSKDERYRCWSHLEFVLLAYTCFADFTEEETAYCMKHITLKDFLCLIDHLADIEERSILRTDFGIEYMQEMALGYLLKLMLRAKGRGDVDVNNYCMICTNSVFDVADEHVAKEKTEKFSDIFYLIKDRLDLNNVSWISLDIGEKEVEFGCLRELMVSSMEDSLGEEFSLPGVIERCKTMCKDLNP